MDKAYFNKVLMTLTAQPEGGSIVTTPVLSELMTEGDTVEEALADVPDSMAAVGKLQEEFIKPFPLVRHDRQR